MKKEILVNLMSLKEVFLSKNKDDVEKASLFLIEVKQKNNIDITYEIKKTDLEKKLIEIFSEDMTNIKSVELYYIIDNEKKYLNGISIF